MEQKLTKEQWLEEVYRLLCKTQGAPENENEEKNLREWALAMADGDNEDGYFYEGDDPETAVWEEIQAGS